MQLSNQYNSFLGGEVSESLWYRADMDKFGKWFANAENIRFTTMGSFTNRPGFVRVGPVLDHQLKPVVKLIPFVFNNEEVFEIEFVTGKFRVRKHGEVIKREDGSEVVYDSPIKIESLQQLKYAQSGDIIFIASGTSPVMELRRLKTDGTEWVLENFQAKLLPAGETNEDKNKTIQIVKKEESFVSDSPIFDLGDSPFLNKEYNQFDIYLEDSDGKEHIISILQDDIDGIVEQINNNEITKAIKFEAVKKDGNSFSIFTKENSTLKTIKFETKVLHKKETDFYAPISSFAQHPTDANPSLEYKYGNTFQINNIGENLFPYAVQFRTKNEYVPGSDISIFHGDFYDFPNSWEESIECLKIINTIFSDSNVQYYLPKNILKIKTNENNEKYLLFSRVFDGWSFNASWGNMQDLIKVYYGGYQKKEFYFDFSANYIQEYDFELLPKEIDNISERDVFVIKNDIEQKSIVETISSTTITETVLGSNKWRFYSSGNWKGEIDLQFSKIDEDEKWISFRKINSAETAEPGIFNDNSSGTIEGESLLKYRIFVTIESGSVNVNFYTNNSTVNSYYQVLQKLPNGNFSIQPIKNNIGVVGPVYKWRKSAFSVDYGYPETIGFYQNRLFFGKGYELWGSRINDFWDFYEPVELQKDDPINMSILTYKVNTIKNILTTKSFFVFTTGGEFGIASQGAISQDDKFLKQFSSHGSNDCTPLIVGNIVLFVDATGNTVRAFQYSFEADNYEATDISLFIEEKIQGKQIITAEYIRSTKECLFLDADGIIWVFKYMPEQNIMSWSHWKHGRYKITNLCVTPNGAYDELYVVVDAPDGKFIERLDSSVYSDSVETYAFEEEVKEVQTQLVNGTVVNIDDGINNKYKATVDEDGKVKLRSPSKNAKIGLSYTSTGTLLAPTISLQDGSFTTYRKQRVNKVFFVYRDSFGFKVGEEGREKMEVEFNTTDRSIEESTALSSGKKSVLIPDSYDSASRVSFVQNEPYPMHIVNVLLESDYGGQ